MNIDRVWIIHPELSPALSSQGQLARFRKAEIKIVPTLAALAEELEVGERLIMLAVESSYLEAQRQYGDAILAARILPRKLSPDSLYEYLEAVLQDSVLQHELEVLETNAWTGMPTGKYDEPLIEFLGKTVLEISSCRDLTAVEHVLYQACNRITPTAEVVIAHDPPNLSSRVLGKYQLAVPINFNAELKAHIYVRFDEKPSTDLIESVGELILNLSDITALSVERSHILTKAEQTKLLWEASFNAVEDPVVILNEKLEVVRANKAYGSLLQSSIAKLIGKRVGHEFLDAAHAQNLMQSNASHVWDMQFDTQWYRVHFDPIISPTGAGKIVLRLQNVSGEHSLTEKILAREQVAELGILVGSVAHEINNPIGGILALGQLLTKELDNDNPVRADIENIVEAAERCKKIVQTMLSLVRKASDQQASFQLGESISAAVELVSTEVQRLGLKIERKGLDNSSGYTGNRNRIMQVCFHLLQGALQALEERKAQEKFRAKLSIELKEAQDSFEISFIDNGLHRTHEHSLKNSVSYAVANLLLEEHHGKLSIDQEQDWNRQLIVLPRNVSNIPS